MENERAVHDLAVALASQKLNAYVLEALDLISKAKSDKEKEEIKQEYILAFDDDARTCAIAEEYKKFYSLLCSKL